MWQEGARSVAADSPAGETVTMTSDAAHPGVWTAHFPALLMPIRWDEPFGVVMLEAMAVGTPVVALNRGAVPEVVQHGETGLVCTDPAELPDALVDAGALDPMACAEHARVSFSADLMARRYERVYQRWAAARPAWTAQAARVRYRRPAAGVPVRPGRAIDDWDVL